MAKRRVILNEDQIPDSGLIIFSKITKTTVTENIQSTYTPIGIAINIPLGTLSLDSYGEYNSFFRLSSLTDTADFSGVTFVPTVGVTTGNQVCGLSYVKDGASKYINIKVIFYVTSVGQIQYFIQVSYMRILPSIGFLT